MNEEDGLQIIALEAENFKRLKAVRMVLTPNGMVKLVGRNGQGKTSVIDAIAAAMGGKEHLPQVPVRAGQEEGFVKLDFGSLKARLNFDKARGSWLTVTDADGKRISTPQQVLDRMSTEMMLDPMEFMHLKAAERIAIIKKLVPGFDFAGNARARKEAYDRRTDIGRDYKRENAVLYTVSSALPIERPPEIDVSKVSEALRQAEEHNNSIAPTRRRREEVEANIIHLRADIETHRERIKNDLAAILRFEEELDGTAVPELIDTNPLHAALTKAADTNRAAEQFDRAVAMRKAVEDHRNELRRLDVVIENLDDLKVKAVQEAKLPVENLSFGEDDVLIDGLPFEQASTSQQLMVSTAIAMALKPTFRIILLRQAAMLDHEHLKMIEAVSKERKYQIIAERLDDGKESGIIIEDGEVLEVRP